jgi:hypothetical protein
MFLHPLDGVCGGIGGVGRLIKVLAPFPEHLPQGEGTTKPLGLRAAGTLNTIADIAGASTGARLQHRFLGKARHFNQDIDTVTQRRRDSALRSS